MPDPDGGARIAFAEELPAYLQLAEGWLAAMAAVSEDASREDGGLEGVLDALHERVAGAAALVADAQAEYPSIVARCPVVILCICPSLSTLRSIYAAASTLMRDIAYEIEVERIRAEQADAPERQVRILNEAAADYSSAASDWDAGTTDLAPVAAALVTMPPWRCDRCGVDDVIAPVVVEGAPPDGDEGTGPDGEAPPAAVVAGPRGDAAWIASAEDVVAQLRRAEAFAAALVQRERGLAAALRLMRGEGWRGHTRRRVGRGFREQRVDLELVLGDARAAGPEVLDRCLVAMPCTCPSLRTLHGLNRAHLSLRVAIAAGYALVPGEDGSPASRRRLSRLTTTVRRDYERVLDLRALERDTDPRDFAACDRCGAPDAFRALLGAA